MAGPRRRNRVISGDEERTDPKGPTTRVGMPEMSKKARGRGSRSAHITRMPGKRKGGGAHSGRGAYEHARTDDVEHGRDGGIGKHEQQPGKAQQNGGSSNPTDDVGGGIKRGNIDRGGKGHQRKPIKSNFQLSINRVSNAGTTNGQMTP